MSGNKVNADITVLLKLDSLYFIIPRSMWFLIWKSQEKKTVPSRIFPIGITSDNNKRYIIIHIITFILKHTFFYTLMYNSL